MKNNDGKPVKIHPNTLVYVKQNGELFKSAIKTNDLPKSVILPGMQVETINNYLISQYDNSNKNPIKKL